jgi:small-conductance mechanosensitive channel
MDEWITLAREAQAFPWVRALEVIAVSALAAKIVDLLISRFLLRLTLRTHTDLDDRLVQLLHRPVFISVILVGLYIAVKTLGWSPGLEWVLVAAIQTAAVFVWTGAGFKLTSATLEGLSRLADRVTWIEARTLPLFDNLSKIVVFSLALYSFLVVWDLDLSAWLASAGIMGIAVGFAAKDSLANLFGGLFVIMDAPYKLGDFINLDTGERGRVIKIGLRSTRLLTRDDVEITLPNAHIANAKVVNESGGPYEKTRVAISVGVAYGSDVDRVREVLQEAALSVECVVRDPLPRVRFVEMGDSSLIFRVQAWIDEPAQRGICIDGLNTGIYKALARADIEIPFPQRVVHGARPPTTASS